MKSKSVQYGYVESGRLHILNKGRMQEELRNFPDCDVEVTIKRKGKRSLPQNRYYFGIVLREIQIALHKLGTRTDIETLHEWAKQKFNYSSVIIEATGERIDIGQTTTELNKEEFSDYITRIIEWANMSLHIVIPEANSQTQFEFKEAA